MKKLFRKVLFLLPIPFLIAGVNLFSDPAHIFSGGKYEQGIATHLLSGKNVENVTDCDERLLQKYFLTGKKVAPEIVVLGSSRVMMLSSDLYPSRSFFNSGVSGAALQDLVAIVQLYESNEIMPEEILIGVDPWFISPDKSNYRWKTLADEYKELRARILGGNQDGGSKIQMYYSRVKELFSLSYFQHSLRHLPQKLSGGTAPRPTASRFNPGPTRLSDGAYIYGKEQRERSTEKAGKMVKEFISNPGPRFRDFTEISEDKQTLFKALLDFLISRNIKINFFLVPFHPEFYDYIQKTEGLSLVLEAEKFFKSVAGKRKIKVYGNYNPARYNLGLDDFFDALHPKTGTMVKVFNMDNR